MTTASFWRRHFFTVENVAWRRLAAEFGNWNSVWKRFWRLSDASVFEAFFQMLAEHSPTAHLGSCPGRVPTGGVARRQQGRS